AELDGGLGPLVAGPDAPTDAVARFEHDDVDVAVELSKRVRRRNAGHPRTDHDHIRALYRRSHMAISPEGHYTGATFGHAYRACRRTRHRRSAPRAEIELPVGRSTPAVKLALPEAEAHIARTQNAALKTNAQDGK